MRNHEPQPGDLVVRGPDGSIASAAEHLVFCEGPLPRWVYEEAEASSTVVARARAAWSPGCPLDILQRLATDTHHKVQVAIATRGDCPSEVLMQVYETTDDEMVRWRVMQHPACPAHLRAIEVLAR